VTREPGLAQRFVCVDQGLVPAGTAVTGLESGQRMIAPDLFRVFGVTATPTLLLIESEERAWLLTDLVEGAEAEWPLSRLEERDRAAASTKAVAGTAAVHLGREA
jgi:hypothetical protein